MQPSTRRRASTRNVWESRIRMDAVNGGIKVYTADAARDGDDESNADEEGMKVYRRLRRHRGDSIAAASRTRRSWAPPALSENVLIGGKTPIRPRSARSEPSNKRVLLIGEGSGDYESVDEDELEIEVEEEKETIDDKEMDKRMEKPDIEEEADDDGDEIIDQIHEVPLSTLNVEKKQNPVTMSPSRLEKKQNSPIPIVEKKQNPISLPSPTAEKRRNSVIGSPPIIEKKQNPSTPPLPIAVKKQNAAVPPLPTAEKKKSSVISTPPPIVEKKLNPISEKKDSVLVTLPIAEKKQTPVTVHQSLDPEPPVEKPFEMDEEILPIMSVGRSRLQSIVDLIMWRDVSKTAFVFGFGSFFLVSSSYARDLNFSLISAASYAGLVYLAMIFFYKSILNRGEMDYDEGDERYMLGEEEAIRILRLLLPYINELLSQLKSLFSGDPATTMKLAVLLFVMARCGSSITLWSLAKMSFLGIFTIPKVCSSYSTQLAKHGKFWLERFRDGWESCTHKKAAAAVVFTLIWNVSSNTARIWAVFMLVVAMKLYQQYAGGQYWGGQEEVEVVEEIGEDSNSMPPAGHRQGVLQRHRGGPSRKVVVSERKMKREI